MNADSQKHLSVDKILKKHEQERQRAFDTRIMNEEHGTFTQLLYLLTGGEGNETSVFHKHVAQKIEAKTEEKYEHVLSLIRCKPPFLIVRSVLMCIRGSRPTKKIFCWCGWWFLVNMCCSWSSLIILVFYFISF